MTVAWTEPKYPGGDVRCLLLIRGDEIGDVRIMDYGLGVKTRYRVAAFLPGEHGCTPGDTPKTWPDRDAWCVTPGEANSTFLVFVDAAKVGGWKNLDRETGKAAA